MKAEKIPHCDKCRKALPLCLCELTPPVSNKIRVVILQHPQEKKEALGTAHLLRSGLENSDLKLGLSWPNAQKALGATSKTFDPKSWVVLYLGTGVKPPKHLGTPTLFEVKKKELLPFDTKQKPAIQGVVILDGSWAQAKALWWRNPWLLKLRRAVFFSPVPSLYGRLRKEPRKEALSTIESTAFTLTSLGEPLATQEHLMGLFAELLKRYRENRNP